MRLVRSPTLVLVLVGSLFGMEDPPPERYQGKCMDAGCHGGYTERKVVHSPVSQGACDSCHEAIPDKVHNFRLVREGAALCAECHEDIGKGTSFVHGPVAAGECTACHDPHASDHALILRDQERKVCLECHTEMEEKLGASKSVHRAVSDGCLSCHKGHGAKNKAFLVSDPPTLCYECHEDIQEIITSGPVKHSAVAADRSCLSCHDAHASTHGGLLSKPAGEVCLSCHSKEVVSGDQKVANIGALMASLPNHHKPVADGECSACHDPHGGQRHDLLSRDYPSKFYAPYNAEQYALCLECHEVEAFTEKETDSATSFRNGTQNLHFVHVNLPVKGRTCGVCHDAHATKAPKQIVESVPFGNWRIPLNFRATATGGSCLPGCHAPQKYDREKRVNTLPPPPDDDN